MVDKKNRSLSVDAFGYFLAIAVNGTIILLGDGFPLALFGRVFGLPQLLCLVLFATLYVRMVKKRLPVYVWITLGWVALFGVHGVVSGNKFSNIGIDAMPVLYGAGLYFAYTVLGPKKMVGLQKWIGLFLICASIKAFALAMVQPDGRWDNAWQAAIYPLNELPLARVILRGADAFFATFTGIYFVRFLYRKQSGEQLQNFVQLIFCVLAVVLSMTRTNYVAVCFGVLFAAMGAFVVVPQVRRSISLLGLIATLVVSALLYNGIGGSFVEMLQKRSEAHAGVENSLDVRIEEISIVYEMAKVRPAVGYGLGASLPDNYKYKYNLDMDATYVHNVIGWLVLKSGALGVLIYTIAIGYSFRPNLQWLVRSRFRGLLLLWLEPAVGMIILLISSFGINRLATMQGAAVLGILLWKGSHVRSASARYFERVSECSGSRIAPVA